MFPRKKSRRNHFQGTDDVKRQVRVNSLHDIDDNEDITDSPIRPVMTDACMTIPLNISDSTDISCAVQVYLLKVIEAAIEMTNNSDPIEPTVNKMLHTLK